jgi:hypothetical protein
MNAVEILTDLHDRGLTVTARDGMVYAQPRAAITDEVRRLIRSNKSALVAALTRFPGPVPGPEEGRQEEPATDSAVDSRRRRVIDWFDRNPKLQRVILAEDAADQVHVMVGLRGAATFELTIPRERYDGIALLELIEKYSGQQGGVA